MKSEREIYEKDSEEIFGVETRPDQANVGDKLARGKPLSVGEEGLAEGKPSASAADSQANGADVKIFGAVT